MKIGQIALPNGDVHAVAVDGAMDTKGAVAYDVSTPSARTTDQLLALAISTGATLADVVSEALATSRDRYSLSDLIDPSGPARPRLTIPIHPPEVWGCGVTYKKSAEFRDEDAQNTAKGIYDRVYTADRPEIFFKGTSRHCVGPNEAIGVRSDSEFTAPEPELALVLGANGQIVGFSIADDVSAWDIERENPLYLPLSKIYDGCCSIGPIIVTPDEIGDATSLEMSCKILREGRAIFEGEVNTSRMNRTFNHLIDHLTRDNTAPPGTVICTGTGIIVEREHALVEGDVVEITVGLIGTLRNPVARLSGRGFPHTRL